MIELVPAIQSLFKQEVEFVILGGVAIGFHGSSYVTQDLDFSDVRHFAPGTHHGLLLIRMSQPGRKALIARIVSLFQLEDTDSWQRCFVVTTDQKLRVRHPSE